MRREFNLNNNDFVFCKALKDGQNVVVWIDNILNQDRFSGRYITINEEDGFSSWRQDELGNFVKPSYFKYENKEMKVCHEEYPTDKWLILTHYGDEGTFTKLLVRDMIEVYISRELEKAMLD